MNYADVFAPHISKVAVELFGQPQKSLDNGGTLRWGSRGSFKIDTAEGVWHDKEANVGGGVLDLVMRERSCDKASALTWLEAKGIIPSISADSTFYDYRDERAVVLYRVERRKPGAANRFVQHGPDGQGGFVCRSGCMKGVRRVPYRLPELIAADAGSIVFVTEGEKDADRLANLGLVSTTNAGGAGEFRAAFATHFAGRRVVMLEDNDKAGRDHAADVLSKLRGGVKSIATVRLPGLPDKGDVSDWLNAGGTAKQLYEIGDAALLAPQPDAGFDPETGEVPRDDPLNARPDQSDAPGGKKSKRDEPSEDDVALAFTAKFRETLRFDHTIGTWFEWDGTRWRPDNRQRAFTYARLEARRAGGGGKANFAGGVERFARADLALAVEATLWNPDPMLLGTPGGTVDLRTGKLSSPRADNYVTKLTSCTPETGNPEIWLRFLEESMKGDKDTIRFLQQWSGYCLTGLTSAHALFFIYGPGGNGKSVFLNTLIAILGDYAVTAAMETFTASRNDRHSTELAMLCGARLVTANETEEGRTWAEARIKALTGGDPITARFMRQDNFTFRPQFKLTIAGNHAPQLANVDDAMKRRFNIVPFVNTPPVPDRDLERKLAAEHGKILAWMIDGCKDWTANGLKQPETVQAATADYFEDQDLFGQWISERCEVRNGKWELATPLFNSWRDYAREAGDDAGSAKGFSSRLKSKGFLHGRVTGGYRKYDGLALRRPAMGSDRSDAYHESDG